MSDPHQAYSATNHYQPQPTRHLTEPVASAEYEPWTPAQSTGPHTPISNRQQFSTDTSTPPPLDIPKFAGGTIGVMAIGAATAALVAAITNAFADGLGLPWVMFTFGAGTAAAIGACLAVICAAVFLLLVWQTNSAPKLLSAFGALALVAALFIPFVPFSAIIWPATVITAAGYGIVVAVVASLTRTVGVQALRVTASYR